MTPKEAIRNLSQLPQDEELIVAYWRREDYFPEISEEDWNGTIHTVEHKMDWSLTADQIQASFNWHLTD